MPVWKYAKKDVEVSTEEIDKVLSSLICFNCGVELHSKNCPFAKLRAELIALKKTGED
jgi:hypothetical protein